MANAAISDGYVLKVGDLITITHAFGAESATLEGRGCLHGDDFLEFAKPIRSPENTVFQICVRTRVSAAQELQQYEKSLQKKGLADSTTEEKTMLATLRRVHRKEQAMNENLFKEEVGSAVKFGAVVQLKHVRTGKFLCCSDTDSMSLTGE